MGRRPSGRFVFAACAALVLAPLASASGGPVAEGEVDEFAGPFEQELRVRRWALDPMEHRDELEEALGSERWQERALALEALQRRGSFGGAIEAGWQAAVQGALEDEHPDVVVKALGVLARMGGELSVPRAEELAQARLPSLRIALCEALRSVVCDVGDHVLLLLALDPDERVRAALRTTVGGVRPGRDEKDAPASWPKLALVQTLRGLERDGELFSFSDQLLGAPLSPGEWVATESLATEDALVLGLVETLRYARREAGDYGRWQRGYEAALDTDFERLFFEAARSQSDELARAWMERLATMETDGSQTRRLFEWIEALFLLASPERIAALAFEVGVPAAIWEELLSELGLRMGRWDPELAAWLVDPERPLALRKASVRAFAYTLDRELENWPWTAQLLLPVLSDPDVTLRERALHALFASPDPRPYQGNLLAAFEGLEASRRSRMLERVPRDVALEAFLPQWIALGADEERRRLASDLVRAFLVDDEVGDPERDQVRAALREWLAATLREFSASDTPDRWVELTLQSLVQTMGADAAVFVADLDRVALASHGTSKDVTKAVFAALVRTPAGEEQVRAFLAEDVELRTRVEAALHFVTTNDETAAQRAFEILTTSYEACDTELKRRTLKALESYPSDASVRFLAGFVFATRNSPEERALALSTLAKQDNPLRRSILRRAVSSAGDIEARLLAARTLGRSGDEAAVDELRLALEEVRTEERLGDEERELLRTELLLSMGRTGHFPPEEESGLFDGPLAQARSDMEARFRGEDLAKVTFSWRSELYLAVYLGRAGRLDALLDRTPGWYGLDGRFLIRLGLMLLENGGEGEELAGTVRRLLEAGLVASEGEARPDPAPRFEARSRLLALAWHEERYADAARLVDSLLLEERAGLLPNQDFARAFGVLDPPAGIDPRGRLESAQLQARAYVALEAGEKERAAALAREARLVLGSSELALKEQERLESRL